MPVALIFFNGDFIAKSHFQFHIHFEFLDGDESGSSLFRPECDIWVLRLIIGKFGVSKKVWFRNIWPLKKMKQNDKKKTKTNSKVKGLSFVSTPNYCDAYRT